MKRAAPSPLATPASSLASTSASAGVSQVAKSTRRKRARLDNGEEQVTAAPPALDEGERGEVIANEQASKAPEGRALPIKKRQRQEGSLRKLKVVDSTLADSRAAASSTLSGSRVGGKSKDLSHSADGSSGIESLFVTRSSRLGLSGYVRRAVQAFSSRGAHTLHIHAMGAAIPMALTLALATRDALPGGALKMETRTSTVEAHDEIEPDDEVRAPSSDKTASLKSDTSGCSCVQEEDMAYQTRTKSAVTVSLIAGSLKGIKQGIPGSARHVTSAPSQSQKSRSSGNPNRKNKGDLAPKSKVAPPPQAKGKDKATQQLACAAPAAMPMQ